MKMHLQRLQRWVQFCMVINVAASLCEGFKNPRHLSYKADRTPGINLHLKDTEDKITSVNKLRGRRKNGLEHTRVAADSVTTVYSAPSKRKELYTNTPLAKKQEIFEEYEEPVENHARNSNHDDLSTALHSNIKNNYKKTNIIDVDSFKQVSDIDTAVGDAIDSIFGADDGIRSTAAGDEKDSIQIPTATPTSTISTIAATKIKEDVEKALDQSIVRNKNIDKEIEKIEKEIEDRQRAQKQLHQDQQQQIDLPSFAIDDNKPKLPQQNIADAKETSKQQQQIELPSSITEDEPKLLQGNIADTKNSNKQSHHQQQIDLPSFAGEDTEPKFIQQNIAQKMEDHKQQHEQQQQQQQQQIDLPSLLLNSEDDTKLFQPSIDMKGDHQQQSIQHSDNVQEQSGASDDSSNLPSEQRSKQGKQQQKQQLVSLTLTPGQDTMETKNHGDQTWTVTLDTDGSTGTIDQINTPLKNSDTSGTIEGDDALQTQSKLAEGTIGNDSHAEDLQDEFFAGRSENMSSVLNTPGTTESTFHPRNKSSEKAKNDSSLSDHSQNVDVNDTKIDEPRHNKSLASKFIKEHPAAFNILLEYFQNETRLQEKVQDKLRAAIKGTGQATKKSLGVHFKMEPPQFKQFLDKVIKLAELKEDAKKSKLASKSKHSSKKKKIVKQKSKQVSGSRKAEVSKASNVTTTAKRINVTSFSQGELNKKYVTQQTMSSFDVTNALKAMENTINNLLAQTFDSKPPPIPSTQHYVEPIQAPTQQATQIPMMDSKTYLYKQRLKSLQISLSQDYFSFWMYHFRSFEEMSINPKQLRSGIASLGSTTRLGRVVKKALRGEPVTLLIVGGSISAGGGLERDRHDVHGIYFKAFEEWWKKVVTPITASTLQMDVVAIGGTDSEYFSYCVKNYIKHEPDLVIWELAANDYRRYTGRNMDPAKPLEQLTRLLLTLPSHPAIIFVNFFRGDYYKTTLGQNCPDSEDEGGRLIAEYYQITSLSWRNVICSQMKQENIANLMTFKRDFTPLTLKTLFSSDGYHPSLLGHAQCASLLISYIRSVFEEVVSREIASINTGIPYNDAPNTNEHVVLPRPIYDDPHNPSPLCWTLLTSDYRIHLDNHLPGMRIVQANGFGLTNITHWPVRTDRLRCLKAERSGAFLTISFYSPPLHYDRTKPIREIALITHNSFSGSATVWLDNNFRKPMFILEPTGQRRTQMNIVSRDLAPGGHTLNIRAEQPGFCVSALAIL